MLYSHPEKSENQTFILDMSSRTFLRDLFPKHIAKDKKYVKIIIQLQGG